MNKFIADTFAFLNSLCWIIVIAAIIWGSLNNPFDLKLLLLGFVVLIAVFGAISVMIAHYQVQKENNEILKQLLLRGNVVNSVEKVEPKF